MMMRNPCGTGLSIDYIHQSIVRVQEQECGSDKDYLASLQLIVLRFCCPTVPWRWIPGLAVEIWIVGPSAG
jgi:hypothetical protein